MIRTFDQTDPTVVPAGCLVDEFGTLFYDTTIAHVEAATKHYDLPLVVTDEFFACVRVLPDGRVLILRAPIEAGLHACVGCGLELDGDDPNDSCDECLGGDRA